MKPFEEQFTAWVDGKLNGDELAEFEKHLTEHPEAAAERTEALRLGELLRAHPTTPRLTNPDFFNYQLMARIEAETPRRVEKKRTSFWSLPRLAWAGAFCLTIALALFKITIPSASTPAPESKYFAQIVEAWPVAPNVSATTVYSAEDNVTVVWLDGLDYIPAPLALN